MKCQICPHHCNIDRKEQKGRCQATNHIQIARAALHFYEEPCISGKCGQVEGEIEKTGGSGTVFFSHCNMDCVFCQNHEISQEGKGKEITIVQLVEIFIQLQEKGAHNINLVTPTIYVAQIKEAIDIAKEKGLKLPIIYNTSGYETVETIRSLSGYVDVYLPDFKYYDNELAKRYSRVDNYLEYVTKAMEEMYQQVGDPVLDEEGYITRGIIIRHMILPNHTRDSKRILQWIDNTLGNHVYVSLMAQYFPTHLASQFPEINRKITNKELHLVTACMQQLGFQNGYVQKIGKHEEEYVPAFDFSGI